MRSKIHNEDLVELPVDTILGPMIRRAAIGVNVCMLIHPIDDENHKGDTRHVASYHHQDYDKIKSTDGDIPNHLPFRARVRH